MMCLGHRHVPLLYIDAALDTAIDTAILFAFALFGTIAVRSHQ